MRRVDDLGGGALPNDTIWIDLFEVQEAEAAAVKAFLDLTLPDREEISEIEVTSRLFQEGEALHLTANVISGTETDHPESWPVRFILVKGVLVTLRFNDPLPFRTLAAHLERHPKVCNSGDTAFAVLLEAIIDRLADILESVAWEMDRLSRDIFTDDPEQRQERDFNDILVRLGRDADLASKARESLVSIARLTSFAVQMAPGGKRRGLQARLKSVSRDINSLSDHAAFLSGKTNFLLDASLGMISIEQSGIIKIFSVVAVVFLPPTLIASIYGMNFDIMPELHWAIGYPLAILAMILSAVGPYYYFKRKGWL